MKKYNKSERPGDNGLTQLGTGFVEKINPQVKFVGKLSTCHSHVGAAIAACEGRLGLAKELALVAKLLGLCMSQVHYMAMQSPTHKTAKQTVPARIAIGDDDINDFNKVIETWQNDREVMAAPNAFILAATPIASAIAVARDLIREAEALAYEVSTATGIRIILNRMSDLLDLLVRHCYIKKI